MHTIQMSDCYQQSRLLDAVDKILPVGPRRTSTPLLLASAIKICETSLMTCLSHVAANETLLYLLVMTQLSRALSQLLTQTAMRLP